MLNCLHSSQVSDPCVSNTFCLPAASRLLHPLQPSTQSAQVIRIPFIPHIIMRPFHYRCPLRQPTWNQGPTTMCGINRPSYPQYPQYPQYPYGNGGQNHGHGHGHGPQVEQAYFSAEYLVTQYLSYVGGKYLWVIWGIWFRGRGRRWLFDWILIHILHQYWIC